MTDERYIKIDVDAEVKSYFDASSESHGGPSDFTIGMGGPAVGKTTDASCSYLRQVWTRQLRTILAISQSCIDTAVLGKTVNIETVAINVTVIVQRVVPA